jgi:magnesium transporter
MVRAEHTSQVRRLVEKSHPADIALVFPSLTPSQRRAVFEQVGSPQRAAEVLSELESPVLDELLDALDDQRLARLVEQMASDDAADILQWLDDERKQRLLDQLSREEQSEAESLMGYHPESAGGLMSTEVFALDEATTAGEAIRQLQSEGDQADVVFYLYVVNSHGHLVGVMSLRELVRASKERPIGELMISEVIRVTVDQDQEDVARLVARYNLLALPVVDANNRLVGVVTVDDIIDVIRHEATEDIMKMAGAGEDVSPHDSPIVGFRARLPWSLPSFIAGILGVVVVSHFEDRLLALIPLAALIPMLMGMAGNVGTQSSTIVTRWLAIGRLEFVQMGRIVGRELFIGFGVGLLFGALAGVFVTLYFAGHPAIDTTIYEFAIVTGASLAAAMALAAVLGASAPLVFERLGLDPAIATGPFVTTTIDVLAVWLYLGLAAGLLT